MLPKIKEANCEALRLCFAWAPLDHLCSDHSICQECILLALSGSISSPDSLFSMYIGAKNLWLWTLYMLTPLPLMMVVYVLRSLFGCEPLVTNIYGMKTDKEFVNTLENNICC